MNKQKLSELIEEAFVGRTLDQYMKIQSGQLEVWRSRAALLETKVYICLRVIAAYDAWPYEGYGDLSEAKAALAALEQVYGG